MGHQKTFVIKEFSQLSYEDIILCCLNERHLIGSESGGNREPLFSVIADSVAAKLLAIYIKTSILTVSPQRIVAMIQAYHKKYRSILKQVGQNNHEDQS